jgi:Sigma-54 interaction domain
MAPNSELPSLMPHSPPDINRLEPLKTVCNVPIEERLAGVRHHPNMLIEGPQSCVEETLVALNSDFHPNVACWPDLPAERPDEAETTVIVRDVGDLDDRGQQELEVWMEHSGPRFQVVSTSTSPLFGLVERGAFRISLYYRLNTLRVVLNQSEPDQPRAGH